MKFIEVLRAKLKTLNDERNAAVDSMDAVCKSATDRGSSTLNAQEKSRFDTARSRIEVLDGTDGNPGEIAEVEARIAELEAIEARAARAAGAPFNAGIGSSDPWREVGSWRSIEFPDVGLNELRSIALDAVARSHSAPDASRETLTRFLEDPDLKAGELAPVARWAAVASDPDYMSGFAKLLADPFTASVRMTDAERGAFARVDELKRTMVIGTPSAGGYMMPLTLDPAIILTSAGNVDPMPAIARTVFITTDVWKGVSSAGVSSSWDAESSVVSDDTPTVAQPTVTTHRLTAFVPYSIEAEQDLPGLITELQRLIGDDLSVKEGEAYWTGTGSGQPRGLVVALDANAGSEVAVATGDAFVIGDVYKLNEALPARFRQNATWAGDVVTLNKIRRFGEGTTGSNSAFWADLGQGQPPTLLDRPVVEASPMEAFTGSGAQNILVFGDFSNYVIARRVGATMEIVQHLADPTTGRPTGERGLYAYCRVGGNCVADNAFRVLQS